MADNARIDVRALLVYGVSFIIVLFLWALTAVAAAIMVLRAASVKRG